ncbi:galactokinase [Parasteatoda tepidariorum]|uniref:galactokinase n=1 Tax=Parasteatoda tepidariorum TaxID=114398 RepID=UPI001C724DB2|nr:galactokinase [Parasteatoda tepidariorum]
MTSIGTEDLIKEASELFFNHFKTQPTSCGCAPGRVNLIGEHTDYNDGFVLPMALPLVTVVVGRKNGSNKCHLVTACPFVDEPRETEFDISLDGNNTKLKPGKPAWANYIKGVIANYYGKVTGFDALVSTNVPVGGGLSSSAALEVATYCFLETLFEDNLLIEMIDKVLACQKAEHDYSGMPCGIMDQFISFMGKKDHVLLLDCRSLDYQLIELNDPQVTILITNTNVRHKLAESQYSNRKLQCETASRIIGKSSLRDVSLDELEKHRKDLDNEVYKRALHVIGEIGRTTEAADALSRGNYKEFGNLMNLSHASLRDNYEVSCSELDLVVSAALEVEGVYGSRMTGGGFGGCTVTLLKTDAVTNTMEHIKKKYKNPTFYACRPGSGAQKIQLTP